MTTDRVQAVLPNCIWTKAELACSSIRINTLAETVHESFIREVAMAGTQSKLNRQYHDGMSSSECSTFMTRTLVVTAL
jgi:hypothetical protein